MNHVHRLFFLASFLFVAGCNEEAILKKLIPPADEAIARDCVESLRQGKLDKVKHELDPEVADSNIDDTLAKMSALFPTENPEFLKVVGANFARGQGSSTTNIKFEYKFSSKWLLANVAVRRKDDSWTVIDFHVTNLPDSLENLNKFALVGKSPVQYFVLALALSSVLFSLYTLIICIRTKEARMRWLWALSILVGVGQYAINWTTGRETFTPISFHVPCAYASKTLSEPWIIAVSLPVGAILFLNYRWKLKIFGKIIPLEPTKPPATGRTNSGVT